MGSHLEAVVANLQSGIRRETMHGREFIVAPATLLVEGVLNGSNGALYYPSMEINRDPMSWNYMPIVLNHPKDPTTGQNISARNARVLDKDQFGILLNAVAADGKLQTETWFDVANTKRIDSREGTDIYGKLERGEPIELSTGLFTDNESHSATFNGKAYNFIARNYRPDHLAVLPKEKGACSVTDGCGINVNKECNCGGTCTECKNESKKKPQKPGESTMAKLTDEKRKELVDGIVANCRCEDEAKDRATLNELEDTELERTAQFVANAAADDEEEDEEEEEVTPPPAAKNKKPTGNSSVGKVAQRKILNEMSDGELDDYMKARKTKNAAKEAEEEEEPVGNQRPITVNDLPADLREDIEYARAARQREKGDLVARLTANIADESVRKAQTKRLMGRSLADLREDLALLPVANEEETQSISYPLYPGPGPVGNRQVSAPKPEPMGQPQWDWDGAAKENTFR